MLKLAMTLDNPGEPVAETRYRDPKHLAALGYNGLVLFETTSLSGIDSPDSVGGGEIRRWVEHQFEVVRQTIARARAAGLEVYFFYDVLSLARGVVSRQPSVTCKNRPTTLCPASDAALELSGKALEMLLGQWPDVAGVVLRFGDNNAARTPYLLGNDIYIPHCPRCATLGRADRISLVLNHFHKIVVQQANKRLIARAWNVRPNGMHDSVELCERLRDRLPGDPKDDRFVLSFKFTETDFWRFQRWNPASLVFGDRPILYELQCQREFEGKGGVPDWQAPLWRNGPPECAAAGKLAGLANLSGKINLAGLWAWVRGGGWGGPFLKNETWIDANVVAVPKLADNPQADPRELADQWIRERLNVTDPAAAAAIHQTLEHSPDNVLHGFYIGPFARSRGTPWHPNGDWVSDDLIDAQAAWRIVQRLPDADLDEVIREKTAAVEQVQSDRGAMQLAVTDKNRSVMDPLANTLGYTESLFEAFRDLFAGLVAYRRYQKSNDPAQATLCRQRLLSAQTHWNHHTQRQATLPGNATAFREAHFWELTQKILGELG